MAALLTNSSYRTRKEVLVSVHSFVVFLRPLSNLTEKYMAAFRHKHVHKYNTQSNASRRIMASAGNVPI